MITQNDNAWNERDDRSVNGETGYNNRNITNRNSGNDDDWDSDDELEGNDDFDEVDTVGDDIDADYDEDTTDDEEDEYDEEAINREQINDAGPKTYPGQPDTETPEREEADAEKSGYPHETEYTQQDGGNDASYSEQNDVTPPRTKEFPAEGNATTDFASRKLGRTTGRMVGHEPGTEGI